ncbi:MAG: hypothetical protein ACOYML_02690, partial [Microthrixaceae bacterium]
MTNRRTQRRAAAVTLAVALVCSNLGAVALGMSRSASQTQPGPSADETTSTSSPPSTASTTSAPAPTTTAPVASSPSAPGVSSPSTTSPEPPPTTALLNDVTPLAQSTIGVTKTVSRSTLQPGDELEYAIVGSCSSLTEPCVDFTITDTLPAEFDVTSIPQSNSDRVVTYDAITRLLTVVYQRNIGGGQTGLPAGTSQSIK